MCLVASCVSALAHWPSLLEVLAGPREAWVGWHVWWEMRIALEVLGTEVH